MADLRRRRESSLPGRGGEPGSGEGVSRGGELADHRDHKGVGSQDAVGSGGEDGHVGREEEGVLLDTYFLIAAGSP
jgi:hypothetical protein